ncbi:MAG: hypothetical protein HN350_18600 [Phycisphaerales bacterium]|jgi:hypothetical protein|nr:hypothetical protein [Phycisphaerales bacterium]
MKTPSRILISLAIICAFFGVILLTDIFSEVLGTRSSRSDGNGFEYFLLVMAFLFLLAGLIVHAFSKAAANADKTPAQKPDDADEQFIDPGTPLCPHCLAPTEMVQETCDMCGTVLTSQAGIDPVQQFRTMGRTLGDAAANPKSRIVLIGMWCVFAIPVVMMIFAMVQSSNPTGYVRILNDDGDIVWIEASPPPMTPRRILQFAFFSGILLLYTAIVIKTTRNYFRKKGASEPAAPGDEDIDEDV